MVKNKMKDLVTRTTLITPLFTTLPSSKPKITSDFKNNILDFLRFRFV